MKKLILLLCLLSLVLTLFSCGNKTETPETTDESSIEHSCIDVLRTKDPELYEEWSNSLVPVSSKYEVFEISKNIFSGMLLNVEYPENFDRKKGTVTFTIEVDEVFRGNYVKGNTVKEVFSFEEHWHYSCLCDDCRDEFFEEGQRYFFMLGTNDDVEDVENAKYIQKYSKDSVLKMYEYGRYEKIFSSNAHDSNFYAYWYGDIHRVEELYLNPDFSMKELYNECDDVYYGEQLEYQKIGEIDIYGLAVYRVKVKVMNVYKGNYKPGDIIEDISCYNNERDNSELSRKYDSCGFYFTGDFFDKHVEFYDYYYQEGES